MWKVENGIAINECDKCCFRCGESLEKCENMCEDIIKIECEKCKYQYK